MTQDKSFNKDTILNIIIIVLCTILFGAIIISAAAYIDSNAGYEKDEQSMLYSIHNQRYASLVEDVYHNEIENVQLKGDMAEIYAAAHYYENAVLYYAHQKAGNMQQAGMRYDKMQEYKALMGEYIDEETNILNYLEDKF